jgi:hypothetical protein
MTTTPTTEKCTKWGCGATADWGQVGQHAFLCEAHGREQLARVRGEVPSPVYPTKHQRIADMRKIHGLTSYMQGRTCIRWVAVGKRCGGRYVGCAGCLESEWSSLYDHPKCWKDSAGNPVLSLEPYGIHPDDLDLLRRDCTALGLEATVHAHSPYGPGTTLILIARYGGTN